MKNQKELPLWVGAVPAILIAALILASAYISASANSLAENSPGGAAFDAPVTIQDGDAYNTYQVACSSVVVSTNAVTLLTSTNDAMGTAWTGSALASRARPRLRRRVFVNTSNFWVYIGSNSATGLLRGSGNKGGFGVGPSTTTASVFETHNSSDFYCNQEGAGTNGTAFIAVLEEYNTIP